MELSAYELIWIFAAYSFLGWMLETISVTVRRKRLINRGVLNGPFCTVYGLAAVILTVSFSEQADSLPVLFIGCMIDATIIEWLTGKLLERIGSGRWWDYSRIRWNLDGYICLPYSLLWGVLGAAGLTLLNPVLLLAYRIVPKWFSLPLLWCFCILLAVDLLGSLAVIRKWNHPPIRRIQTFNTGIARTTARIAGWLAKHISLRLERAYPSAKGVRNGQSAGTVFAQGCCFHKLTLLFVIGAFLGDITEMIFCRLTAGYWMSRSSLVWGQFSIVWGFAIVLATILLYRYRNRSYGFLFLMGTIMGGAYEYFCSVFSELVFGTIFWDYSHIPLNLGGRINLLFCFFWGLAAIVWLKWLYPLLSSLIERIPVRIGIWLSRLLTVFMVCNMAVSALAMYRYEQRAEGAAPQTKWETYMDTHYDDERMQQIYPKAKMVNLEEAQPTQ